MCTEIQSSVTILVQKLGYPIILNIFLGIRMLVTRYKISLYQGYTVSEQKCVNIYLVKILTMLYHQHYHG